MADAKQYAEWILANQDKKGTPEYDTVAQAYRVARAGTAPAQVDPAARQQAIQKRVQQMEMRDEILAKGEREAKDAERRLKSAGAWAEAEGPIDRLGVMAKEVAPTALNRIMGMGVVGGSTAIGQKIGSFAGAPGRTVGGAVGGSIGSALEQISLVSGDPTRKINKGEIMAAGVQGAITSQGAKTNALTNTAAEIVRSLVDEGKMPSAEQLGMAAAMGYGAAKLGNAIVGKELTPNDALMVYRHDAWRKLKDKGFVVNPMHLRTAGGFEGVVQSTAGKIPLDIGASRINQYAAQRATREELGLPKTDRAFRPEVRNEKTGALEVPSELGELIKKNGRPYEEVRAISNAAQKQMDDFKAGKANIPGNKLPGEIDLMLKANKNVDLLKTVRDERSKILRDDPERYNKLAASFELEEKIEGELEKAVIAAGKDGLLKRLKKARVNLAKLYAVNDATDPTSGLVDMNKFAEMMATTNRPGRRLTGLLKDMGDFASAFGESTQNAIAASVDRVANEGSGFGLRNMLMGNPAGFAQRGVPLIGGYARDYLLEPTQQKAAAAPRYMMRPETITAATLRGAGAGLGRGLPSEPQAQP